MASEHAAFRENLLCIVPPYAVTVPPAGPAALLGYLKAFGINDVDFLDLRLYVPDSYATTYSATTVWGQALVIDIPDLPIVLKLFDCIDRKADFLETIDPLFSSYCLDRGINPGYLFTYLKYLDRFFETTFAQLPDLKLVGFSVWNSNFLTTLMAARHLKKRRNPPLIVTGGPQVTESPNAAKLALASGLVDVVVLGEGEEALRLIYEEYSRGARDGRLAAPVPGSWMFDHHRGEIISGGKRPLLRMTSLPLPDFDRFDLPAYQKGNNHLRTLPFQLSRGCTDKCAFCTEWKFWEKFRPASVEQTLDQIDELKRRYDVQGIAFTDSLLNGVVSRLHQFAEGMEDRKLDLKWGGYMRANMDTELATLLKRSGYVLAFIGVESLADETLEAMNKRMTGAQNLAALEAFLSVGIAVRAGFIPGFPGDSRENFMNTAASFAKLQQKYPSLLALGIEPFVVSPGQLWYENLAEQGLIGTKWEQKYLDIAPKYQHITKEILCGVDGNNQGQERIGRYRIAVAVSQLGSNPGQTFRRRESIREADFMYYSYEPEETESASQLRFQLVHPGWFLATFKTDHGTVQGYFMSTAEKDDYERIRSSDRLSKPWATGSSLIDTDEIRLFLETVASHHLVTMSAGAPALSALQTGGIRLADRDVLGLSPFLLARVDESDPNQGVMLLNVVNGRFEVVPSAVEPLLTELSLAPASLASMRKRLPLTGVSSDLVNKMREIGAVIVLRSKVEVVKAVASVAPPPIEQVATTAAVEPPSQSKRMLRILRN